MRNRRQRIAISKAKVARECTLYGPLLEGARAFREGLRRGLNPHHDINETNAWFQGWDMAKEKANETC